MTRLIGWPHGMMAAAALIFSVAGASAQTPLKAWPDQQPQPPQQQPRAWPGDPPAQQQPQGWPGDNARSGAPRSAGVQPFPSAAPAAPPPMIGAPGMGMSGPPRDNPCMGEFTRLRTEVEKASKAAKSVNDRKGTREEFCKAITGLHAAQAKWAKYGQDNQKSCGIPNDVIGQLKGGASSLAKIRTNVCSGGGGPGGPPAAPSLSEALGTSRMTTSTDEVPRRRGGSLDTLTGETIR